MNRRIVTAIEIAEFIYCPEYWRLQALGHDSTNQSHVTVERHNAREATAARIAGGLISMGFGLIVMAAISLAILWWLQR